MDTALPRTFADRHTLSQTTFRDFLKIVRTGGFADADALVKEAHLVPRGDGSIPSGNPGTAVGWVGHATTIVRLGGRTFLTDPVWSPRIPGNIARLTEPGMPFDALPPIDGVVISHNHYDHLDAPTVKRLPRDTHIHCGLKMGGWFRRRGFTSVHEQEWWEPLAIDGIERTFVPVEHWCQRLPWDRDRALWGGWVLRKEGAKTGGVFFAGDTAYCRHFADIGARFPGLDAAILPIGAYEPRWFMRNFHMEPEEAIRAFLDLGAKTLVPMHWGTFPLTREPLMEPPRRLTERWETEGLAEHRLALLPIGGSWTSE